MNLDRLLAQIKILGLPMRYSFRSQTRRVIGLMPGKKRWAEFSPFPDYSPALAARCLASAYEFSQMEIPQPRHDQVPINATLPIVSPSQIPKVLAGFAGCKCLKAKVGDSFRIDIDRITRALDQLGPETSLRLDVNGGWTANQAIGYVRALRQKLPNLRLDYLEQPCPDLDQMLRAYKPLADMGVGLAWDESLRLAPRPQALLEVIARLAPRSTLIIKAGPLGGFTAAFDLAQKGRELGLKITFSSALESSVGMGLSLALAQAWPWPLNPAGLGTASFFSQDAVENPRPVTNGYLRYHPANLNLERLEQLKAEPTEERRLREQLIAGYRHTITI